MADGYWLNTEAPARPPLEAKGFDNMFRKIWMRGVLIVLGTLLGLALTEVAFTLFPHLLPAPVLLKHQWDHSGIKVPDEVFRMRYQPGLDVKAEGHPDFSFRVRTRSLGFPGMGFRDDGIDPPVYGVVVGDSHTWGFGVEGEETFPELLEKATSRDFVNLARTGDSSIELGRILESFGMVLDPKVAVWAFYANDLRGSQRFEWRISRATRENILQHQRQKGSEPLRLDPEAGFAISTWVRLPRLGIQKCLADPAKLEGRWTPQPGEGLRQVTEKRPQSAFGPAESFTWTAWLRAEPRASEQRSVVADEQPNGAGYHLTLLSDGHLNAEIADSTGHVAAADSEGSIADGEKHFVAAVFDREKDRLTLWIDNRESDRSYLGDVSGEVGKAGGLHLAGTGTRNGFPGRVHEVALYRGALSESELRCLFRDRGPRWGGTLLSRVDDSGRSLRFAVGTNGRLLVRVSDGEEISRLFGNVYLRPGKWSHVVASFQPPSVSFFVDGHRSGRRTLKSYPRRISDQTDITLGGPWPLYGALDEFRIHGGPLTEDQAKALASSSEPKTTVPPLLAHWTLDDERCCRVEDQVGFHDGVSFRIRPVPGKSGTGLEFNGLGSKVSIPFATPQEKPEREPAVQRLFRELWIARLYRFTAGAPEYAPFREGNRTFRLEGRGLSLSIPNWQRSWVDPTKLVTNPVFDEGWRFTRDALSRAQELTRRHGVRLVVVVIPFKLQTYWHLMEDQDSLHRLEAVDVDWISDLVREFCESRGIEVVDMTPVFRQKALEGEQLFFEYDTHVNALGHRTIAETLAERLMWRPRHHAHTRRRLDSEHEPGR